MPRTQDVPNRVESLRHSIFIGAGFETRSVGNWVVRKRCAQSRAIVAAMFLFGLAPATGWAWGKEGHRLTGLIAEQYLTPAAKAKIAQLLGGETLADLPPWADSYPTEHPETGKWHYVNIPSSEAKYDRDCPIPRTDPNSLWRDCVTDRILLFEQRLKDAPLSPAERTNTRVSGAFRRGPPPAVPCAC